MKISDYELVNHFDLLFQKEIVLYTTGSGANTAYRLLSLLNLHPVFFCDSSPEIIGKTLHELRVYDPGTMVRYGKRHKFLLILCTTTYIDEIIDLIGSHINEENITVVTLCGLIMAMRHNFNHPNMTKQVIEELKQTNHSANINLTLFKQYMYDLKLSMVANAEVPLIIYQPGKVGSSSILSSVQSNYPMAVQAHRLVENNTDWLNSIFWSDYKGHPLSDSFKDNYHEIYSDLYAKLKEKKKIKVITLVREPLSRDLSCYFQFIRQQYNTIVEAPCLYEGGEISLLKDSQKYFRYIYEQFHQKTNWFFDEFSWYQKEFEKFLGIDIFQYPFDQRTGYCIIKKENIEILVLKTECLNTLENVIGDFLDIPSFHLTKSNDSSGKIYRFLYEECKKNVVFPKEYVDFYYNNNKFMNYFYSEQERHAFLNKWKPHIGS